MTSIRFKRFFISTPVWQNILLSIAMCISAFAIIWLWDKPGERGAILHYNIFFGVDLIGPWQRLLWIPSVASFALLVNTILAYALFVKNRTASILILVSTSLCEAIVASGTYLIVYQNVS
jgi:hypothetical protein